MHNEFIKFNSIYLLNLKINNMTLLFIRLANYNYCPRKFEM